MKATPKEERIAVVACAGASRAQEAVRSVLELRAQRTQIAIESSGDILVLVERGATELRKVPDELRAALRDAGDVRCWVGIGGMFDKAADLGESRRQAHAAISLAQQLWRQPRVVIYEDVLLAHALGSNIVRRDQLESILDPIVRSDDERGTQLLLTIEEFYRLGMSVRTAARRLGVHRHTLTNRLEAVERLIGRDLRGQQDRMLIESALLARRLRTGIE